MKTLSPGFRNLAWSGLHRPSKPPNHEKRLLDRPLQDECQTPTAFARWFSPSRMITIGSVSSDLSHRGGCLWITEIDGVKSPLLLQLERVSVPCSVYCSLQNPGKTRGIS